MLKTRIFVGCMLLVSGCGPNMETTTDATTTASTGAVTSSGGTDPTSSSTNSDVTTAGPGTDTEPSGTDSSTGVECTNNSDCGFNEVCTDGTCVDAVECLPEPEVIYPRGVEVMLVLDKGHSMAHPDFLWDHDGDDMDDDGFVDDDPMQPASAKRNRWLSLHVAVNGFVSFYDQHFALGATLLPSVEAKSVLGPVACIVSESPEVPVGEMQAEVLLDTIPGGNAGDLEGGTTTTKALNVAYGHLDPSDAVVVLVTDGSPTCRPDAQTDAELLAYDETSVDVVADAWNMLGIPTYVVGINIEDAWTDDLNPHVQLGALAEVSGVPNPQGDAAYFGANTEAELVDILRETIGRELACSLDGFTPIPGQEYTMLVNGEMVNQLEGDGDCETDNGWMLADDRLRFCGQACTAFISAGTAELEICGAGE